MGDPHSDYYLYLNSALPACNAGCFKFCLFEIKCAIKAARVAEYWHIFYSVFI